MAPGYARKAKGSNEYEARRPETLSTFVFVFKTEPSCAMYLGYDLIGEFRKLELSFYALEFSNVWAKYSAGGKGSTVALELIRDLHDEYPDDRFPA
ncbi:MAG: hypothetical protein Q9181_007955, partial [Wetmoreana brouardii]